jgi:hypothetical protein
LGEIYELMVFSAFLSTTASCNKTDSSTCVALEICQAYLIKTFHAYFKDFSLPLVVYTDSLAGNGYPGRKLPVRRLTQADP